MATVAIILGNDFEDSEYRRVAEALRRAGHEIEVLGIRAGDDVVGRHGMERVRVDAVPSERAPSDYDAVIIPGGYSPDRLRLDKGVVAFVKTFARTGRAIAAASHGPQLLIEADVVRNRRVTSWPSVRKDLENAGARWVDEPVVVDGPVITAAGLGGIDDYCEALLQRLRPFAAAI